MFHKADLTDEQITEIKNRGYLRLEEDILYPLLQKSANYWAQLMKIKFITKRNINITIRK